MNATLKRSYQLIILIIVFFLHALLGLYIFTMLDLYKSSSLAMLVPFDDETSIIQFMPGPAVTQQSQTQLPTTPPEPQQPQPIPTPVIPKEQELELERMHFAPAKKSLAAITQPEQEQIEYGKKELNEHKEQPILHTQMDLDESEQAIDQTQDELAQKEMDTQTTACDATVCAQDSYAQPVPKKSNLTPPKKSVTNAPSKPQLTIQDLARQFMQNSSASANNHVMDVTGDSPDAPSPNQITQERYVQKIISCLVNSYAIHRHKAPQIELPATAAIYLALNPDGSIYRLEVLQSSGMPLLDQFIMHMFTDASSSFPPMPQVFNNKRLELPVFTFNSLRAFESVAYWRISVNSKFLP